MLFFVLYIFLFGLGVSFLFACMCLVICSFCYFRLFCLRCLVAVFVWFSLVLCLAGDFCVLGCYD